MPSIPYLSAPHRLSLLRTPGLIPLPSQDAGAPPSDPSLSAINTAAAAPPPPAPASSGNDLLSLLGGGAPGGGASGSTGAAAASAAGAAGAGAGLDAFSGALVPLTPGGFKPFQ